MKNKPEQLVQQIVEAVIELAALAGASPDRTQPQHKSQKLPVTERKDKSGATGGLRQLIDEGKLNTPKHLPEIIELLRQDGRHYSRPTVSMGLLNLFRERILTRFRDKGDKNWKYVIRK